MSRPQSVARIGLGLALAAGISWLYASTTLLSDWSLDAFRRPVIDAGPLGPVIFVGLCVLSMLLHLPEVVVVASGGVLFGALPGFLYGWIGTVVGASLTFALARVLFRDALRTTLIGRSARLQALDAHASRHGFRTVFVARLFMPLLPPLNWVFAPTRVRFRDYVTGTALGIVPGVALLNASADAVAGMSSLADLLRPETLALAVAAVAAPLCAIVAGRRFLRSANQTGDPASGSG